MGNNPSCIPLPPSPGSSSASSSSTSCKVIHADGRVTRLPRPVRASELMLDHPGKFVCDACRLAVGCRVPGVAADELLQPRRSYFLLPIDMLYSVLTDEEMAALSAASHGALAAASSAWKRIVTSATAARRRGGHGQSNGAGSDGSAASRVFPVVGLLQLQGDHGGSGAPASGVKSSGAGAPGLRRHRSWKPVLDTIDEAP
ncbi:uncharacterized protein [Lolium perenne]|uniref:uncharacterized protein n=1 Tax=Lolium perenne TaxID=4522 RepID=UPI0021EA52E5|nr:uncharacterized protein LOC127340865 [Lolium perenne]